MQKHEVTNEEYRRFDGGHAFPVGEERWPVVNVTWREAMAYAVSVGGRRPTEVQWEFAARGLERRKYPWGNSEPTCERVHYSSCHPVNDDSRRLRGGSFLSPPFALRAADRVRYLRSGFESEDIGFRVVWPVEGGRD